MKMKCPYCKKIFYVYRGLLNEYVYKTEKQYFCSYTCWRSHNKELDIETKRTR